MTHQIESASMAPPPNPGEVANNVAAGPGERAAQLAVNELLRNTSVAQEMHGEATNRRGKVINPKLEQNAATRQEWAAVHAAAPFYNEDGQLEKADSVKIAVTNPDSGEKDFVDVDPQRVQDILHEHAAYEDANRPAAIAPRGPRLFRKVGSLLKLGGRKR
jgi:hypothetical protein